MASSMQRSSFVSKWLNASVYCFCCISVLGSSSIMLMLRLHGSCLSIEILEVQKDFAKIVSWREEVDNCFTDPYHALGPTGAYFVSQSEWRAVHPRHPTPGKRTNVAVMFESGMPSSSSDNDDFAPNEDVGSGAQSRKRPMRKIQLPENPKRCRPIRLVMSCPI